MFLHFYTIESSIFSFRFRYKKTKQSVIEASYDRTIYELRALTARMRPLTVRFENKTHVLVSFVYDYVIINSVSRSTRFQYPHRLRVLYFVECSLTLSLIRPPPPIFFFLLWLQRNANKENQLDDEQRRGQLWERLFWKLSSIIKSNNVFHIIWEAMQMFDSSPFSSPSLPFAPATWHGERRGEAIASRAWKLLWTVGRLSKAQKSVFGATTPLFALLQSVCPHPRKTSQRF